MFLPLRAWKRRMNIQLAQGGPSIPGATVVKYSPEITAADTSLAVIDSVAPETGDVIDVAIDPIALPAPQTIKFALGADLQGMTTATTMYVGGTDVNGDEIYESVDLEDAGAAVTTVKAFKTVTSLSLQDLPTFEEGDDTSLNILAGPKVGLPVKIEAKAQVLACNAYAIHDNFSKVQMGTEVSSCAIEHSDTDGFTAWIAV